MNHPHASLLNILNFMWCVWKSRNDCLFNRKSGEPYQISIHSQALASNLELCDNVAQDFQVPGKSEVKEKPARVTHQPSRQQGSTIQTDINLAGPVIFSDAAWKYRSFQGDNHFPFTGIGVYIKVNMQGKECRIMIQASAPFASSAFQAETQALALAGMVAQYLQIQRPSFLTDSKNLAKVAASRSLNHPLLHWDSRDMLADFYQATSSSIVQVFHIKRDLNRVAHNNAKQVLRQCQSQLILSCTCSAHRAISCTHGKKSAIVPLIARAFGDLSR